MDKLHAKEERWILSVLYIHYLRQMLWIHGAIFDCCTPKWNTAIWLVYSRATFSNVAWIMLHGCVFDVIFDVMIVLFCWVQQNICSISGGSTLKCCARSEQCWTRLRLVQHYSRSHNISNVEPSEVEQLYNVIYSYLT